MKPQAYVLGFFFTPCRRCVVLIEKTNPAWQMGKLNGVGGKVEKGERPVDAISREFEEETGQAVKSCFWEKFATLTGDFGHVHCFRATSTTQIHTIRSTTEEHVSWVEVERLAGLELVAHAEWLIPMARTSAVKKVTATIT